jgi:hypothetical protein
VAVPFGHWKTITVTAGLRASGLTATALFDGPMTGARFRAYVEQTLYQRRLILTRLPMPGLRWR